jgi:uncharacterized protein DUF955
MSSLFIPKLYVRPDSEPEIAQRAKTLLIRGDCLGILPTPIEHLYDVAKVEEIEVDREEMVSMWGRFSKGARNMVMGLLSKVRGAADLKKRVVFVPQNDTAPRILFARAHELGHQALPWHCLNCDYLDDDQTLSPRIKDKFEVEANLFAAEAVFQGERFRDVARQYRPEFASIFELARLHGASNHATFWRFVEVHDEPVAGIVYYPACPDSRSNAIQAGFMLQNVVTSARFRERYGHLTFDGRLDFHHEWAQARLSGRQPVVGEMPLMVNGSVKPFLWEAFWNRYCLMVLVRRRPALRLVGGLIRRVPWG